jgi:hypothetical protein
MISEGKKGGEQTAIRPVNPEARPLLDELIVEQATNYIKAHAKGEKPFFTYVAFSDVHMPEAVDPDFDQTDPSSPRFLRRPDGGDGLPCRPDRRLCRLGRDRREHSSDRVLE